MNTQGADDASQRVESGANARAITSWPTVELRHDQLQRWHSLQRGDHQGVQPQHDLERIAGSGHEHRLAQVGEAISHVPQNLTSQVPQVELAVERPELGIALAQRCRVTRHPPQTTDRALVGDELLQVQQAVIAFLRDDDQRALVHRAAEIAARVPHGSLVAQELVADVANDTYCGVLAWEPERKLTPHLIDEVRRRAQRMRKRAQKYVPIEHLNEEDTPVVDSDSAERERDAVLLRRRIDCARLRIGDDPATLQLLTLYQLGVTRKRDVLAFGMSPQAYRRARDRLLLLFGAQTLNPETAEFGPQVPIHKAEHQAEHDLFRSKDPGIAATSL
jgi:hypothetical protein